MEMGTVKKLTQQLHGEKAKGFISNCPGCLLGKLGERDTERDFQVKWNLERGASGDGLRLVNRTEASTDFDMLFLPEIRKKTLLASRNFLQASEEMGAFV